MRLCTGGFVAALLLTAIPFAAVALGFGATYWIIGTLGLVQILVHFRCFLHIDLSRQKHEDLQLILFSTLILLLMVCGTILILGDLRMRMRP